MLTTYLNTLKMQGSFTIDDIANLSGIAKDTVKNVMSGKTKDPGIETLSRIIYAMGGSLDAAYGNEKTDSAETNSMIILKEMHEKHIADVTSHYEHRLSEMKEHYIEHIETIKLDKKWFRIATCVLAIAFLTLLIAEVIFPAYGWIRY